MPFCGPLALTIFTNIPKKGKIFRGGGGEGQLNIKCVSIFYTSFAWKFLILRRIQLDNTEWATKEYPAFRFSRVLVILSLALVCILRGVFEQLINSLAVNMFRYTRCTIVIMMAATAWLMLTVLFKCPQRKVRYTNEIRTRYRNWRTTSATQLQPSKSLCYIGYTSTWLDVRSCVLMQEATTCNIFYDVISFQLLATVLMYCIYAVLRT